MNRLEFQMLDLLRELREKYGAVSIRAEFESEGTQLDELLRLKEVAMRAGLGLTLKIGGCESIRDLIESRVVGVRYVSAPMIESAYALQKYVQAVKKVFLEEELAHTKILANVETITGIRKLDQILASEQIKSLNGIIVERVDLCFSLGLDSDSINQPQINELVASAVEKIRAKGLTTTIGGGVSGDSLPFFRELGTQLINRYETRKVTFDAAAALNKNAERGILAALAFERFYLKNKITFFKAIKHTDQMRLDLLDQRYWQAITQAFADTEVQ